VADGVDQQVNVVVVEPGEGVVEVDRDSASDARGEAQDSSFDLLTELTMSR